MVGEVSIEKDHGVRRVVSKVRESSKASAPIAATTLMNDLRSEVTGYLGGIVGAAVVDHQVAQSGVGGFQRVQSANHQREGLGLVERGNDDRGVQNGSKSVVQNTGVLWLGQQVLYCVSEDLGLKGFLQDGVCWVVYELS
mgnify:CR=1 FL=1